jgi:hypothetical protein
MVWKRNISKVKESKRWIWARVKESAMVHKLP